jgi:hypothetical protein
MIASDKISIGHAVWRSNRSRASADPAITASTALRTGRDRLEVPPHADPSRSVAGSTCGAR